MKKYRKEIVKYAVAVIIAGLSIALCLSEALYSVDKIFSDPLYYMLTTTDSNIKIIAIDEKTLEELGPMNTWTRDVSAELVEILTEDEEASPSIIAFDIMYVGGMEADSDARFVEAAKNAGNVVTAANVVWRTKVGLDYEGYYRVDESNVEMIEMPYEDLQAVTDCGFANTVQDRDGYIRFEKTSVNYEGEVFNSFAMEIYEAYCREKGIMPVMPETFGDNLFYFTFSGKNSDYEVISLVDVLNGNVDVRAFSDSIVLVGAYATGMQDAYNVAVQRGAQMYGVEIHANILEALIEEKTAVPVSDGVYALTIALAAVIFYFANGKLKPGQGAILMVLMVIVDVVAGKLMYENGYVMDIIYLPVILLLIYITQLAVRITMANRMQTEALKEQMYSFADAFATAVDERTPYNGTHTKKVTQYVAILAYYMNRLYKKGKCDEYFDKNRIGQLKLAATLHDIGKMIIPKNVMNKATRLDKKMERLDDRYKLLRAYYEIDILSGRITEEVGRSEQTYLEECLTFIHEIDGAGFLPDIKLERVQEIGNRIYTTPDGEEIPYLTDYEKKCLMIQKGTLTSEERQIMENHVVMTDKILSKVRFHSFHKDVAKIAASHHEFMNGTGYPNKLTAKDLSVECRILTIADIYDALTSVDRPYKTPMPREKAFSILEAMVEEGKLDGQLVKWFEEAIQYLYKEESNEK